MKDFIIDPKYYDDIQLIIGVAITRHSSKNMFQDRYAEMAATLKGVNHRNELAYSANIEEIIIRINGNELWALKLAVDDLLNDPHDDVSSNSLSNLANYLKNFDIAL